MFEFLTIFLLAILALTVLSGAGSALLHAKYGHDPNVTRIADAFAAVYLAGSSAIVGALRIFGSRNTQLDDVATKSLPPPDDPKLLSAQMPDGGRPKEAA